MHRRQPIRSMKKDIRKIILRHRWTITNADANDVFLSLKDSPNFDVVKIGKLYLITAYFVSNVVQENRLPFSF